MQNKYKTIGDVNDIIASMKNNLLKSRKGTAQSVRTEYVLIVYKYSTNVKNIRFAYDLTDETTWKTMKDGSLKMVKRVQI